jgi:Tol biopolymer transport system component
MALSPDEKNAAVVAGTAGRSDLWMMDLTSGVFRRMTREHNANSGYIGPWSPDSQRIAVNLLGGGIQELEVASGKNTALAPDPFTADDWSPDGHSLLCFEIGGSRGSRLSVLPLDGATKPRIVWDTPYLTLGFRFSPDGQFVAYTSQESGMFQVFVASFPSFGVKRQISSGGGSVPLWRKDGKELFFREPPGTLMSAEIRTGPKIEATVPRRLFPYGDNSSRPTSNQFAVTADGKRFLILDPVQKTVPSAEIMVVLNWAAELKQP